MSDDRFNRRVPAARCSERTIVGRRSRSITRIAVADIERLRIDAGVSRARLAAAADLDPGYLSRVVGGQRQPSIPVLVALTRALGADLSIRAFPTTGPNIHDKAQAPIVEGLLQVAHPSWRRSVEVAVTRPARGFIDVVLQNAVDVVAGEVQTRLDRLEQSIRWSDDKARSLPSSDVWPRDGEPVVHRMLVLRNTRTTRDLARRFEAMLRSAYPAKSADVYAALATGAPWPGDGILWADVHGDEVRILSRPPRSVNLGR